MLGRDSDLQHMQCVIMGDDRTSVASTAGVEYMTDSTSMAAYHTLVNTQTCDIIFLAIAVYSKQRHPIAAEIDFLVSGEERCWKRRTVISRTWLTFGMELQKR
jgi:hypothetical protein